ncbi:MAG: hypothetical protein ABI217_05985 [Chthoniobacterales bacterium]
MPRLDALAINLDEGLEDPLEVFRRNAATRVADGETSEGSVGAAGDGDRPAGRGKFDRVREQIEEHLLEPIGIRAQVQIGRAILAGVAQVRLDQLRRDQCLRALERDLHGHALDQDAVGRGFEAGKIENVV